MSKVVSTWRGLLVLAAWSHPVRVAAQGSVGESGFPFEPMHAQPVAFGGAGVAMRGAPFALVNPAALAGARGAELSHRASATGARDYAMAVTHGGRWGTMRLAARRRDWGDVARDLGLQGVTAGEQSLSFTFARTAVADHMAWGLSVARLDADYVGAHTATWAFDGGTDAAIGRGFSVGVAVLHAGQGFKTSGDRAPLPTRIRPGTAWQGRIGHVRLATVTDLALPIRSGTQPDLHAGLQLGGTWGSASAAARAGYRSLASPGGPRQGSWEIGGGLTLGPFTADMAYIFGVVLGDERYISLDVRW